MRFNIILFDLDGTLIRIPNNFMSLINDIVRQTCKELGIDCLIKDIHKLWVSGNNYKDVLANWGIKKSDYSKFWKIFDEKDLNLRKDLIKKGEIRLYDDSIPVLQKIKSMNGVKIGVVSNAPPKKASYEINQFNLGDYFDCKIFLGSINQGHAKPEPDGIIWCLEKINGFKNINKNVCYVGDSEIDIMAGKKANIVTAYVIRNHNNKKLKFHPDLILNSLNDLLKYIN
ncbi:MAG: HAD family hydrolase [Candidatus Helarchaeota archaeon]